MTAKKQPHSTDASRAGNKDLQALIDAPGRQDTLGDHSSHNHPETTFCTQSEVVSDALAKRVSYQFEEIEVDRILSDDEQ